MVLLPGLGLVGNMARQQVGWRRGSRARRASRSYDRAALLLLAVWINCNLFGGVPGRASAATNPLADNSEVCTAIINDVLAVPELLQGKHLRIALYHGELSHCTHETAADTYCDVSFIKKVVVWYVSSWWLQSANPARCVMMMPMLLVCVRACDLASVQRLAANSR